MKNIKVLVVEDNAVVADAISITLKKHSLEVVQVCASGEDAIGYVKSNEVDLILMDIVLAGAIDGISAAQIIHQDRSVPIIYLTDHTDIKSVDRAKKTHPVNYLSKPYNEAELVRAIEIAFLNSQDPLVEKKTVVRDDIFLRTDSQQFVRILYRDILYLEAARSYCKVVTDRHTYTLCTSLNQVHENFGNADFIRVHRSYVVNTRRINKLDGNVIIIEGRQIDMGKDYKDNLMRSLKFIK